MDRCFEWDSESYGFLKGALGNLDTCHHPDDDQILTTTLTNCTWPHFYFSLSLLHNFVRIGSDKLIHQTALSWLWNALLSLAHCTSFSTSNILFLSPLNVYFFNIILIISIFYLNHIYIIIKVREEVSPLFIPFSILCMENLFETPEYFAALSCIPLQSFDHKWGARWHDKFLHASPSHTIRKRCHLFSFPLGQHTTSIPKTDASFH